MNANNWIEMIRSETDEIIEKHTSGVIGDPESDILHKCTNCNKIMGGKVGAGNKKRCPKVGGGCDRQKLVLPNNWIAM